MRADQRQRLLHNENACSTTKALRLKPNNISLQNHKSLAANQLTADILTTSAVPLLWSKRGAATIRLCIGHERASHCDRGAVGAGLRGLTLDSLFSSHLQKSHHIRKVAPQDSVTRSTKQLHEVAPFCRKSSNCDATRLRTSKNRRW
jgi:hypothetical protein